MAQGHATTSGSGEPQRHQVLASGTGVSPGVAWGRLCCSPAVALRRAAAGEPVVLAATMTTMADEPAMRVASAVVTTTGGPASHTAVLARAWGIPAVCAVGSAGRPLRVADVGLVDVMGAVVVAEGAVVTIDGASGVVLAGELSGSVNAGPVNAGPVNVVPGGTEPGDLPGLLAWADDVCAGRVVVLANADTAAEVAGAVDAGAAGIGLCRTEHLLGGEGAGMVAAVMAAPSDAAQAVAVAALASAHHAAVAGVLEAAGDRPVTIRLLDAPWHEFMGANDAGAQVTGSAAPLNPMLGVRGVRAAIAVPGLYEAQCAAIAAAVADARAQGGAPQVRLLVPMVATVAEFAVVVAALREVWAAAMEDEVVEIGAMVETPRAALVAGDLATHADFISVGTNDLTQLVFGFSRDDTATLVGQYVAAGLVDADPFVTLDAKGVGALVAGAIGQVQAAAATGGAGPVEVGVCGEHAGDPASVAMLVAMGVDSLSCPVSRLGEARVAAARAVASGDGHNAG